MNVQNEIDNLAIFTQEIMQLNNKCNEFFANQSDALQAEVIDLAKKFLENFSISNDNHIKNIVEQVSNALKLIEKSPTEAIEAVRNAIDIIEAKNIVLTYKEK